MLKIGLGVLTFALWLFCLVDAITTPQERMRHLPKVAWILIVLFFPFVGSLAWLLVGRPERAYRPPSNTSYGEYDRPGRFVATDPAKDEEFLRQVRERAEQQRKAYEAKKKAERPPDPPTPDPDA